MLVALRCDEDEEKKKKEKNAVVRAMDFVLLLFYAVECRLDGRIDFSLALSFHSLSIGFAFR